jgi:hypothetical protein
MQAGVHEVAVAKEPQVQLTKTKVLDDNVCLELLLHDEKVNALK